MDFAAAMAARRRLADSSTVSAEGLGVRVAPAAKETAASLRESTAAIGSAPPRAACGYVGLVNQGATCYLNSLLQVMYCTNDFREALCSACIARWRAAKCLLRSGM